MRSIFAIVSGVKIVPSFTITPMATREEEPNFAANLSWAWMKGWSGQRSRSRVSTRTHGPGSGKPALVVIRFRIG